jgi:hypothetical protein
MNAAMFRTLKNAFRGRKPFGEVVNSPGSSQYQSIPGEVTKSDAGDNIIKPQQFHSSDELKIIVDHIPDKNEMLYLFYVNKDKLNNCPQVPISTDNECILAVIDTVSQISLVKEEMYHNLRSEDMESL